MFFYWLDRYYLFLVIPALLLAVWAQIRVSSTFSRYNQMHSRRGMTAAETARRILDANGLQNVHIERVGGHLSDHYDPRRNVIRLSDAVYGSDAVAAIGVAAHECGHAVQYATGYFPIKIRAVLIPVTTIGSNLAIPLAIFGLAFGWNVLTNIGILLFLAVVLFQLVTLPVEFNASRRALHTLETQMLLEREELTGAGRVLRAAALTYVAALIVAVANLLRLLLLRNNRRR